MHNFKKSLAAVAVTASLGLSFNAAAANSALQGNVNVSNASDYTVTAKDPKTGFSRTVSVNADGSFRFAKMESGTYLVTVEKNGAKVAEDNVRVSLGSNAFASFDLNENVESIEVRGARISSIDLSTTDSGLVIGESELDVMPVARNMTAVALLAPGTVQGDSGFGNTASFGGSSVSENACYINGLEVTNTRNGLGCGTVPFEFYKEFQVKTGGYSAYFGRATGGTINAETKSGTNDWEFAATANWSPDSLEEEGQVSRANGGTGAVFADERNDEFSSFDYTVSASGPIIEDTLFIYALINPRNIDSNFATGSGSSRYAGINQYWYRSADGGDNMFWGAKVDWDITDNHRLSYFAYSNRNDTTETRFAYDPETQIIDKSITVGQQLRKRGGDAQSLSYTGYLTDDLNISAMWGEIESQYETNSLEIDENCPFVTDNRTGVADADKIKRCGSGNTLSDGNQDKNTQYRFDIEWTLGDHNIKGGLDIQERQTVRRTRPIGDHSYTYSRYEPGAHIQGDSGVLWTNETNGDVDVVSDRIFAGGGGFSSDLSAYYIEDQWQVTDNFMLSIGLRKDRFEGDGTTGQQLFDFDTSIAPRLGFTWDVKGDGESKLYGTWGRYYLPIANNTIYRAASGVSDETHYYLFEGTDSTNGSPTGTTLLGTNVSSVTTVPTKDTFQAREADPFARDEFILGYETALSDDLTLSLRATYREVTSALDDYCGAYAWPYCVMVNPGEDMSWMADGFYWDGDLWSEDVAGSGWYNNTELDANGCPLNYMPYGQRPNDINGEKCSIGSNYDGVPDSGSLRTLSAEKLALPKAKNEYVSLQTSLDYRSEAFRMKMIYTWSRSTGNFEGAVKSDINQADAGITQDFDFPALMDGAQGYQANDRRHVLKIFGTYNITDDLSIGFNSQLSSGKPKSAFGRGYPNHHPDIYGSYGDTFYIKTGCADGTEDCPTAEQYTLRPRGSVGRTPWTFNLDLSAAYAFNVSDVDMRVTLDVFNVLNSSEITKINEHYEVTEGDVNPYYGAAYDWQRSRYVRFGFEARF